MLNSITLRDGTYWFSVNLFSELKNIFLELRKYDVNELDYSDLSHTLNKTTIKNSWAFSSDYVYPLIDAGDRLNNTDWRTIDLYPYVRVSRIINEMLIKVGVDPSTFVFSNEIEDYLEGMIYGFGGGEKAKLSVAEITERRVEVGGSFDYAPLEGTPNFLLQDLKNVLGATTTVSTTSNPIGQYTPYTIQVARTGRYQIDFDVVGLATFTDPPLGAIIPNATRILVNGIEISYQDMPNPSFNFSNSVAVDLNSGDTLTFMFQNMVSFEFLPTLGIGHVAPINVDFDFSLTMSSIDVGLVDGATINVGDYLPSMNCADFFNGIITMFNLYLSDNTNDTTSIDTLSKFYNPSNEAMDIDKLVDYSKDVTIVPLANQFAKEIKFKYKANKDFDNQTYFDKYGVNYGDFEMLNQSDLATGEKVFQLPFSNVVPANSILGVDAVIPRFVVSQANGTFKPNKGAPRIGFHNPITCSFVLTDSDGNNAETIVSASSIHHFQNYKNPTMDLNFTLVKEVYYNVTKVTVDNLYNLFYDEFINESTSPDSRLVNLYVNFNDYHIKTMTLQDLIFYKASYFRLNNVQDYNGNTDTPDTTKIELVKVLEPRAKPTIVFDNLNIEKPADPFLGEPVVGNNDLGSISGDVLADVFNDNVNIYVDPSTAKNSLTINPMQIPRAVINVFNYGANSIDINYIDIDGFLDTLSPASHAIFKFENSVMKKVY